MKRFRCGDVVPGCDVEFIGDEPGIMGEVVAHARSDHGVDHLPPEVVAAVREAIVDSP